MKLILREGNYLSNIARLLDGGAGIQSQVLGQSTYFVWHDEFR